MGEQRPTAQEDLDNNYRDVEAMNAAGQVGAETAGTCCMLSCHSRACSSVVVSACTLWALLLLQDWGRSTPLACSAGQGCALFQRPIETNRSPHPPLLPQAYDLVLWGDSLTADMRDWRADVWDDFFPPDQLLTQPLGMGGSTIQVGRMEGPLVAGRALPCAVSKHLSHLARQHTLAERWLPALPPLPSPAQHKRNMQHLQELAARIVKDGERPDIDPKAVVLWVGTNNVKNPNQKNADPAGKLDWCGSFWPYVACRCCPTCRRSCHVCGHNAGSEMQLHCVAPPAGGKGCWGLSACTAALLSLPAAPPSHCRLIQWLQHNMPGTKLAVSGLIPNDKVCGIAQMAWFHSS